MDEEREARFTGWMNKENQGLHVGWRKKTKVYRLFGKRDPRFTDWMKKEGQGLQVG